MRLLDCDDITISSFINSGGKFICADNDPYIYFNSHIINTVHIPNACLRSSYGPVPVQFYNCEQNGLIFANTGLKLTDKICVYANISDSYAILSSSLVIYELEKFGFNNLYLLNGDYTILSSDLLTQCYPEWANNRIACYKYSTNILIDYDELLCRLRHDPDLYIIDARPLSRYGQIINDQCIITDKSWKINGNIPGAVNIFWRSFLDPTNNHKFKPAEEIQQLIDIAFINLGLIPPNKNSKIVVYCGTGREAAMQREYMNSILGYTNIRLYQGSWNEYQYKYQLDNTIPINLIGCYVPRNTIIPGKCKKNIITKCVCFNKIKCKKCKNFNI